MEMVYRDSALAAAFRDTRPVLRSTYSKKGRHQPQVQYTRWMIGLRWTIVTGIFLASALYHLFTSYDFSAMALIALVVAVYNALALLHSRYYEERGPVVWPGELNFVLNLQFTLDILVLAVAIHLTGGVESVLVPIYLVLVPAARLILGRWATFVQVTLLVVILGAIFWLEFTGHLAHNFLGPGPESHLYANATYVIRTLIFQASLLYLSAYLADHTGSRLRRSLTAERQARYMALTDELTGLYNRRHFYQVLEQEVLRSRRHGHTLSLVMFDLDNFKRYNDRYGHLAGDDVLCQLADLAAGLTRHSDTMFRYGGEEFTLILPETTGHAAQALAERLRQAVEEHSFVDRRNTELGRITISLGVATYPEDARDAEGLVDAADMALLRAKRHKNRVCRARWRLEPHQQLRSSPSRRLR